MFFEKSVAAEDFFSFSGGTSSTYGIMAFPRNAKGDITALVIIKPSADGFHRLEAYDPTKLLSIVDTFYPKVERVTMRDMKEALYKFIQPNSLPHLPLYGAEQEHGLINSVASHIGDLKIEFDYEDIFVSIMYGGVYFRHICENNPSEPDDCIDEEDVVKLLNGVLTATIARQKTPPYIDRFPEWKLAMSVFVKDLLSGDDVKVREDSPMLKWFTDRVDKAYTYECLLPNN